MINENINNNNNMEQEQEEQVTITCYNCGNEITEDNDAIINGEHYCEYCRAWDEINEEYIDECDAVRVYTDGYMHDYIFTNSDYAEQNLYFDDDQNEYFRDIDCGVICESDGQFYCQRTIENGDFGYCEDCGNYYFADDIRRIENQYGDSYYCDNCYDDHAHEQTTNDYFIHEYGFKPAPDFQKLDNEVAPYYIGFELETSSETYKNDSEIVKGVKDILPFIYAKSDSSIKNYGVEWVSHPLSYNFIMANKEQFKKAFTYLKKQGFTSHDNGSCGLHFHITRPENSDIIDRILLIMETYKNELMLFSRRTQDQLTHWASFYKTEDNEIKKSLYWLKKNKSCNRYMALNLNNSNTIEFRFIRGTLNYKTFFASVELINNMVKYASDLSLPIEKITWSKLTGTYYAKNYCNDNNIHTDKKIVDNSDKAIIDENDRIELANKTQKILKNYLDYIINDYKNATLLTTKEEMLKDYYIYEDKVINQLKHFNRINDYCRCKIENEKQANALLDNIQYTEINNTTYRKKIQKIVKIAKLRGWL